jgi:hypothetical protein
VSFGFVLLMLGARQVRHRRGEKPRLRGLVLLLIVTAIAELVVSQTSEAARRRSAIIVPPGSAALIPVDFTPSVVGEYGATLTIDSNDPDQQFVDVAATGTALAQPVELFLNPTSLGIGLGGTPGTLKSFYLLSDGSVFRPTPGSGLLPDFQSSNTSVVNVLPDGTLVTVGQGSATITATRGSLTAVTSVTVDPASTVSSVVYTPSELLVLETGQTKQITAFGIEAGNSTDTVQLLTSNASVLSVNSVVQNLAFVTAQVEGQAGGVANLTVRSLTDPNVEQVVEVHVVDPVSLTISPASVSVPVAGVESLVATAMASDGVVPSQFALSSPQVDWSSNAPATAPVFPNGNLVGLAVGSATVTATSISDPGVQGTVPVNVTSAVGLPQAVLSGLAGEDIVANGINMQTVTYGFVSQGGGQIVSLPSKEAVFIVENDGAATAPLEVVFVESVVETTPLPPPPLTPSARLFSSVTAGEIAPGRIGALELEVTLPPNVLGLDDTPSNLGEQAGTVIVYTNDPANHAIELDVDWFWSPATGEQPDTSVTMFLDFGDIPVGESRERTFVIDTGVATGQVISITIPPSSPFSLLNPNPNPFVADAFPVTQSNVDVPLTFTFESVPGASSGRFTETLTFGTNDVDEALIKVLVVAYGAPAQTPVLPADLLSASTVDTRLRTINGSELILVPIPSGDDGLEYEASSGVAYMYSKLAGQADPAANPNNTTSYLFRVPAVGKPTVIKDNLSEDLVAFAVDFPQNLSYSINPTATGNDLLRVTDSGNVSVVLADVFTLNSQLGVDSGGNIYISEAFDNFVPALTKYSFAGAQLVRFNGTELVRAFDLAGDVIYTELGKKYDPSGAAIGSFAVVPGFEWFTADDNPGNILFGDGSGGSAHPQALTLEDTNGSLQSIGALPRKAFEADF